MQPFDIDESNISVADGHKSFENIDHQDSLRFIKSGSAADNLDNLKSRSFKKVGSDKSLHSGVSGKYFFSLDISHLFFIS